MTEWITSLITNAGSNPLLVYALVFLGGLAASFTPCTYPVLPMTVGYVGNVAKDKQSGFLVSLVLVFGMAFTYAVVGMILVATSQQIGVLAGSGVTMYGVALFFMLMALVLLDVLPFPIPRALQKLQGGKRREDLVGAFFVGCASGLVVGPCTGPILGVVLVGVAATMEQATTTAEFVLQASLGGLKLFLFGLGQGALIVLAATFSGVLAGLPKAGTWMITLKKGFALLLLLASSLIFVHVGQATNFPNLVDLLGQAEGGTTVAPVSIGNETDPTAGEGDAVAEPDEYDSTESRFGGDEFLE